MGDIEDFAAESARGGEDEEKIEVKVTRRKIRPQREQKGAGDAPTGPAVWVRTWGCSHNVSDSEYMAGILAHAGYSVVREADAADVWVLNSCTVKTPSEDQAVNLVRSAKEKGKRVVMAGCVSQAEPTAEWLQDVSIVGVKQIDQIEEAVRGSLEGKSVRILTRNRPHAPLDLPKIRKNPLVEVLAISTGCLNRCTYCKTKAARGDLKSISLEDLVARAKQAFEEGVKELWLTSEDLGAWGRDIGLVIPDLLHALVEVIPEGCRMRLGMTNPPYIMDHLHEIAEILLHPRVYRFLHIPIQSASDEVLRHMKREYTVDDFCKAVDYLLERVPDLYIATDFICAYPTESKKDFEESMALVRRYQFPSLFINQYYPRSGTPAAALPRVDAKEAKARTAEMSAYFRGYSRFDEQRIGKEETVLICEEASDGVHLVGHSPSYEQILVPRRCGMGKERRVRITSVGKFHMMAEPVEDIPEIEEEESAPSMTASRPEVIPTNGVEEGLDDVIDENRSITARQLALITVLVLLLAIVVKKLAQMLIWLFVIDSGVESVGISGATGTPSPARSTAAHCRTASNSPPLARSRMHYDREAHKSRTNGERQRDHEGFRLRSAGVCVRGEGAEMRLLLVSGGKDGERWVVPGGGIEKGEAAEAAAVRELVEEAGVRAETAEMIGVFQDDNRKHRTRVFVMLEREEMAEWDDGRFGRRRCWMPITEALSKVKESHVAILRTVMDHYRIPQPS